MSDEGEVQDPAARTLAKYRAHMIAREEHFRHVNEERRAALLEAQDRAEHRLALLRAERDLRTEAEAALAAIVTSTSWRTTHRLRTLLANRPRLKQALHSLTHRLARLVSRRR